MLTYQTWLNRLFGGCVKRSEGPNIQLDAVSLVELIHKTLVQSGTDLNQFSDKQINRGLRHLLTPSSDIVFALQDATVSVHARMAAVRALKNLYAECFEKRARPVLEHLNEPGSAPVNSICFMLWEVTPIAHWGEVDGCRYFDLALEVLEFALYLSNPACVESALHGLGHLGNGNNRRVHRIIDTWMKQAPSNRRELLIYAADARCGYIL